MRELIQLLALQLRKYSCHSAAVDTDDCRSLDMHPGFVADRLKVISCNKCLLASTLCCLVLLILFIIMHSEHELFQGKRTADISSAWVETAG